MQRLTSLVSVIFAAAFLLSTTGCQFEGGHFPKVVVVDLGSGQTITINNMYQTVACKVYINGMEQTEKFRDPETKELKCRPMIVKPLEAKSIDVGAFSLRGNAVTPITVRIDGFTADGRLFGRRTYPPFYVPSNCDGGGIMPEITLDVDFGRPDPLSRTSGRSWGDIGSGRRGSGGSDLNYGGRGRSNCPNIPRDDDIPHVPPAR